MISQEHKINVGKTRKLLSVVGVPVGIVSGFWLAWNYPVVLMLTSIVLILALVCRWIVPPERKAALSLLISSMLGFVALLTIITSFLHYAVESNSPMLARISLALGFDIERSAGRLCFCMPPLATPLQHAAYRGRTEVMRILAAHGAEIHETYSLKWAALGGHEAAVRVLLDLGADPNQYDMYGNTPLRTAIGRQGCVSRRQYGDPEVDVVGVLLDAGANPNARSKFQPGNNKAGLPEGWGPLYEAIYYQRVDVAKLLLARGADPNLSHGGKTILRHLEEDRHFPGCGSPRDRAKEKFRSLLVSAGAQ